MSWNPTIGGHKVFGSNIFTLVCAAAAVLIFAWLLTSWLIGAWEKNCRLDWQDSGYRWRMVEHRCQVQTDDGHWLSELNFRAWLAGRGKT